MKIYKSDWMIILNIISVFECHYIYPNLHVLDVKEKLEIMDWWCTASGAVTKAACLLYKAVTYVLAVSPRQICMF